MPLVRETQNQDLGFQAVPLGRPLGARKDGIGVGGLEGSVLANIPFHQYAALSLRSLLILNLP